MNKSADVFGYQFAAIMAGHLISAAIAGRLLEVLGIKKLLLIGSSISCIGSLLFGVIVFFGITNVYAILIPSTIFLVGFALTIPGMTAGALSNFQHMAGRATSLLGFIQQSTGALVSIYLGYTADGSTAAPMALFLLATSLFGFLAYIILIPKTILKTN